MAVVKGVGPCPIPKENNLPCGLQIAEGEPLGTVARGSAYRPASITGHKKCADEYYARVQQQEKEKNLAMVQRINQSGPGGAVDPSTAFNPVQGSIPLEKPEAKKDPGTIMGDMSQGATFLGDLPEDATPDDAVKFAQGELKLVTDQPRPQPSGMNTSVPPVGTAPASAFYNAPLSEVLPDTNANDGKVVITLGHLQTQVSPEDADDLATLLQLQAKRARRQRGD